MANYNSNSAVVKQVQTAVNAEGYSPPLTLDGVYGPKTAAGVRWFQGRHGLAQDGIIGDQTVAASISPTPAAAAAGGLAGLQAQLQQIQGGASLTTSALLPYPVTSLAGPATGPPATLDNVRPPVAGAAWSPTPGVPAAAALSPPASSGPLTIAGFAVPVWAATAVGVIGGSIFGIPIGSLIGGALGGAVDVARALLAPPAPIVGPAATMHGELDVLSVTDFGFDADYGCDPDPIIAGEIGMPAPPSLLC
jgi:peptidoglycan hydrolase-like protein with peptidoglycan-binding domain